MAGTNVAQPLDATFFAFRKRERGGVLIGLTVVYAVAALVLFGGFVALHFNALGAFLSWYASIISATAAGDPNAAYGIAPPEGVGLLLGTMLPFLFLVYVLLAAYEAGCLRWMIRGESEGVMGLSLGADTWRVYSGYWVWFGLYLGYAIVAGVAMFAIIAGFALAAQSSPLLMIVGAVIGYILYYGFMIYFAVRLAPAAATSVGRRKFSFFQAWTVTRGRFWALFGAFLLAILVFIAIEIVVIGVVGAALFTTLAPAFSGGGDPATAMQALLTPQNMIVVGVAYLLLIVLSFIVYLMFFGINARAVLAAAEEGKIEGVIGAQLARTFE